LSTVRVLDGGVGDARVDPVVAAEAGGIGVEDDMPVARGGLAPGNPAMIGRPRN
jgi:hypothetical protein